MILSEPNNSIDTIRFSVFVIMYGNAEIEIKGQKELTRLSIYAGPDGNTSLAEFYEYPVREFGAILRDLQDVVTWDEGAEDITESVTGWAISFYSGQTGDVVRSYSSSDISSKSYEQASKILVSRFPETAMLEEFADEVG